MQHFLTEFQHIFIHGGLAVWALLVLAILLYGTLTRITTELLKLNPLRRGELPKDMLQRLDEAITQRDITHIFARYELETQAFIQRRLPFAIILTGVAPLAGLLGTVSGMLVTFSGLAHSSAAKPIEKISAGVSEALITTQAGLVIAIPASIFTALLYSQAKHIEASVQKLLHQHLAALSSKAIGQA